MSTSALSSFFRRLIFLGLGSLAPCFAPAADFHADAIVALDGSGRFTSLQDAISAAPMSMSGDPSRIVLLGHSSGGHLVSLAATLVDDGVRVQAVVGFAAVTNHEQDLPLRGGLSPSLQNLLNRPTEPTAESLGLLREISPLNHVRPGLPPFLLIHGDADKTVPLQQSLDFQAKLRANGVRCDLIVIPGAPHALASWETIAPDYPSRLIEWLRQNLGPDFAKSP